MPGDPPTPALTPTTLALGGGASTQRQATTVISDLVMTAKATVATRTTRTVWWQTTEKSLMMTSMPGRVMAPYSTSNIHSIFLYTVATCYRISHLL